MFSVLIILMVFASSDVDVSSQSRDSVFRVASDQAMHHAINVYSAELAKLADVSQTKAITDALQKQTGLTISHKIKRL